MYYDPFNHLSYITQQYCLDGKDLTNLQSQGTDAYMVDTSSLSHMCNLNPAKIKQLQQQEIHISKLIDEKKVIKCPIT